jgi:ketosteroid isomerase-like protein
MRDASFPVVGREASVAALSARPGGLVWRPTFADVSRSGDLGYAYGTYDFRPSGANAGLTAQGNYVRIWKKREGTWRVVLDLLNPVPPAKN